MLYDILVFLSFFQSVTGFILMTSSVMSFRQPAKKRIIIGFIVMLLGIILLSIGLYIQGETSISSFAIFIILAIQLSWFLICSADRFFVSLFSFLTFANIYVSISYISDTLSINAQGNAFILERIIIRLIIYLIILPFLFKYVRKGFRRLVDILDKEWQVATLIPLIFLTMQSMLLYYPEPYWKWTSNNWLKYIIVIIYMLFLAVYYFFFIQAKSIMEKNELEKRQLLMAQQEKLWESELARQKAATSLASQQRHDMHHHNAVVMGLLQNGDIDELKIYMEKNDASLNAYNANFYCSNPIANSIFNDYANRAEKKAIKTEFHVNIPKDIGIDNIDLTCVLGNALENALEACLRLPKEMEKEISVRAKFIDNRLRLQVENTCSKDIIFKDDLPISQKDDGGTGSKSIVYTAELYDGTAGFSLVDGKFITQIVLNGK